MLISCFNQAQHTQCATSIINSLPFGALEHVYGYGAIHNTRLWYVSMTGKKIYWSHRYIASAGSDNSF